MYQKPYYNEGASMAWDLGINTDIPTYQDAYMAANEPTIKPTTTNTYQSTLQFGYNATNPGMVTTTSAPVATTGNKSLNTGLVVIAALGGLLLIAAVFA